MSDTAMIVDGQNLLMRAIFASKGSAMSSNGLATGPLLIFINSLAKHVQEEQPSRLVVCWDGGTSPARVERLASYKAHRKAVPEEEATFRNTSHDLVTHFLACAGIPQVLMRQHEADDLIAGAWAGITPPMARKIVILSSDKDFLQLVGPNPNGIDTELVRLSSAGTPTDRWTYTRFVEENHYDTWNWPLVTALAGDPGDGVPGLRGIGPKKAVKLLEAAQWDLERLKASLELEAAETVHACYDVVNLREISMPVGVPPFRPTRQGSLLWVELIGFLSALEMISVKDRLQAGTLWSNRDLISATESDVSENGRL